MAQQTDLSPEELDRAKAVDLIVIPDDLAERCSNCMWLDDEGHCWQPQVDFLITDPEIKCCGLWDNKAIDRSLTQGSPPNERK